MPRDEEVVIPIRVEDDLSGADRAVQAFRRVKGAADDAADSGEGLTGSLSGLRQRLSDMRAPTDGASKALAVFDGIIGGMAASGGVVVLAAANVAAAAAAFYGLGQAAVSVTRDAGAAVDELEDLRLVSSGAAESVHLTNDALDGMGTSLDLIKVTLAQEFSPAVTDGATLVIALGLAVNDLVATVADSTDILTTAAQAIGSTFGDRFGLTTVAIQLATAAMEETRPAAEDAAEGYYVLTDAATAAAAGELLFVDAADGYIERARDLIARLSALRLAHDNAGESATRQKEAEDDLAGSSDKALQDRIRLDQEAQAQRLADIDDQAEAQAQAEREKQKAIEATFELQSELQAEATRAEADANETRAQLNTQLRESQVTLAYDTAQTVANILFSEVENQKAAALAQIAINTGSAIVASIAQAGVPAGLPGAAAAAAIGAAQTIAVGTTQVPKRHTGGTVPESGPRPPGGGYKERSITALAGERILTENQVAELSSGGRTTVVLQIGDKVFDAATGRAIRRKGSPLNRAQTKGRVGQLRYRDA